LVPEPEAGGPDRVGGDEKKVGEEVLRTCWGDLPGGRVIRRSDFIFRLLFRLFRLLLEVRTERLESNWLPSVEAGM